jgi:hypothetical protein
MDPESSKQKLAIRSLLSIAAILAVMFGIFVIQMLQRSHRAAYLSNLYESTRGFPGNPKAVDELRESPEAEAGHILVFIARDPNVFSSTRSAALEALRARHFNRWCDLGSVFEIEENFQVQQEVFRAIHGEGLSDESCIGDFLNFRKEWFDGKRPRELVIPKDEVAFQKSLSPSLQSRLRDGNPQTRQMFDDSYLKFLKEEHQERLKFNREIDEYLRSQPLTKTILINKFSDSPEFVRTYQAVLSGKRDARFAY